MNYKFYRKIFSVIGLNFVLLSFSGCSRDNEKCGREHTSSGVTRSIVCTSTVPEIITTSSTISITGVVTTTSDIVLNTLDSVYTTDFYSTSSFSDYFGSNTVSESDSVVLDYFSNMGNSIRNNFDSDELLEYGKKYFIYCVDFLFFDGEIKGIKFDDMTDSAKEQLLCDISNIDSLICLKYPNYKEIINDKYSDVYNRASEVIKDGSENIRDFSKEKLGVDNYNKLKEYNDLFADTAFADFDDFLDIMNGGKEKIKDWYEGLK